MKPSDHIMRIINLNDSSQLSAEVKIQTHYQAETI